MQGLLFIAPAVLFLGLLPHLPAYTIVLSFADTNAKLEIVDWVGFENYTNLFTKDKEFLDLDSFPPTGAFVNNLKGRPLHVTLARPGPPHRRARRARPLRGVRKAIVFIPMAISATAVAIIWKFVLTPTPTSAR